MKILPSVETYYHLQDAPFININLSCANLHPRMSNAISSSYFIYGQLEVSCEPTYSSIQDG